MPAIQDLKIAIVDYGMSNLFSVKRALESLGARPEVTGDPGCVLAADAAILPGVGAFGDAMRSMTELGLAEAIPQFIRSGKPFLGVCLGMQLLFSESEEFGTHRGLEVLGGRIVKFPQENSSGMPIRVPQIGWNTIIRPRHVSWRNTPLDTHMEREYMYFVHSYYVQPDNNTCILSETEYEGVRYCSSVLTENIAAFQFHPEKSGPEGIRLYRRWLQLMCKINLEGLQ